jgi:hypothetical protein
MATQSGWGPDPFRRHDERWFSEGQPTKLVRDGAQESFDDPTEAGSPPRSLPTTLQPPPRQPPAFQPAPPQQRHYEPIPRQYNPTRAIVRIMILFVASALILLTGILNGSRHITEFGILDLALCTLAAGIVFLRVRFPRQPRKAQKPTT